MKSNLREYERKRDFQKTGEPKPKAPPEKARRSQPGRQSRFVIQKHAARRLHFDFRLEMGGVLKSWAVPKGIPLAKGDKRLAIHVEDHPLDYAQFEGIIPEGEYGGGTVMVWDMGGYTVSGPDPMAAYQEGKLHLCLEGKKLRGEWTLVRTQLGQQDESGKDSWLLMKTGESMRPIDKNQESLSAISGRTMDQIKASDDRPWLPEEPQFNRPGETASLRAKFVLPMKPKLVNSLPAQEGWIYELKFDGYRAIAVKRESSVTIFSRNEKQLRFPELAAAIERLPCKEAVFDGEIVALDEQGRPSFQLMQSPESEAIYYYLFDLIFLNGMDLKGQPLSERKQTLSKLMEKAGDGLRFSGNLPGHPEEILSQIKARGLEGVVAKRAASQYEPGKRSGEWIKVKCLEEQEFVIGGYTMPKGSRSHLGSVLVGYYQEGKLLFGGKVGTGFSERLLKMLSERFQSLRTEACPFADLFPIRKSNEAGGLSASQIRQCRWVKPEMVCQVKFTEWTRDGKLRQPVFLGIRTDRAPAEVTRERA